MLQFRWLVHGWVRHEALFTASRWRQRPREPRSISTAQCVQVATFIEALKKDFYVRKLSTDAGPPSDASLADHIFSTTPGHGAAIATKECIITQ